MPSTGRDPGALPCARIDAAEAMKVHMSTEVGNVPRK
jgi:hypothetical protein